MEDLLVLALGAGAVVLAPLVPALRPVAKTAIKGGLMMAEATRVATVVIGQRWHEVFNQASAEMQTDGRASKATSLVREVPAGAKNVSPSRGDG